MIFWSEFLIYINKLLTLIFSQYSSSKKENIKLHKVSYNNEHKLSNKVNELDELKRFLLRKIISNAIEIEKSFHNYFNINYFPNKKYVNNFL